MHIVGLPVHLPEMYPPGYPGGIIVSCQRRGDPGGRLHNNNILHTTRVVYSVRLVLVCILLVLRTCSKGSRVGRNITSKKNTT
jgi:hypothetical protein